MQAEHSAWIFPIANLQRHGKPPVLTETARLFKTDEKFHYWAYLHETIDDALMESQCKVGSSPIGITHFGYQWMTDQSAFTKMQKYLGMNIQQIKDYPNDGRAYYNLSLHLLEDGFLDDGLRLLTLSSYLTRGRLLPITELAKCHLQKAHHLFSQISVTTKQGRSSIPAKEYATEMAKALQQVLPIQQIVSPGHSRAFFETHPADRIWLSKHIAKMEQQLFSPPAEEDIGTKDDVLAESVS